MRTLCYVIAATAMIAVAAGMGNADNSAEMQAPVQTAGQSASR